MSSRPPEEKRRLEALRRLGVLDTPPEQDLDDVAELVGQLLAAPFAAVTFVDATRAWSKAVRGEVSQLDVPRGASAADQAIRSADGCVDLPVTDGSPLAEHPVVRGAQQIRRMAAVVISAPDGQAVGAVEVGWAGDRPLDEEERVTLEGVASHVARLLELRGEASEYRRFIELSPDAVTVLDLEGCIELANPALGELLGVDVVDHLVGRTFLELVAPADRGRVATELARVLFAKQPTAQLDMGLIKADGDVVLCSVTAGHLRASRRSLQLAIRNLDERIRAEEERAHLSEQLAQAQRLELAGRLASGLAHDLNNLLVVMHTNLDLATETAKQLAETPGDVGPLHEDLGQLRTAVDRAGELTTKLMQFARRDPGEGNAVPLAEAVDAVQRLLGSSLGPEVRLSVELEDDLPPVAADKVQLEQALVNLVMNARDALPDGGDIVVRAVRIAPEGLAATTVPDAFERHVYLEVSDDGVGMDDETLARAFEPLFTTKGASRGSGLGLPTVQAFVEQLGGTVDLASRPGEGTTVTMLLPAAADEDAPAPAESSGEPTAGVRVLLVDPGESARRVITRMLQAEGYQVRAVSFAEEGLKLLAEYEADIIATELTLPGLSGWKLLERARERRPDLPGLVFTSSETSRDVDGVRTLAKPFSHTRLLRTIEELLAPAR
jgi:two-component system, cell cycle sensor histidine kinase and response regulator CckA